MSWSICRLRRIGYSDYTGRSKTVNFGHVEEEKYPLGPPEHIVREAKFLPREAVPDFNPNLGPEPSTKTLPRLKYLPRGTLEAD